MWRLIFVTDENSFSRSPFKVRKINVCIADKKIFLIHSPTKYPRLLIFRHTNDLPLVVKHIAQIHTLETFLMGLKEHSKCAKFYRNIPVNILKTSPLFVVEKKLYFLSLNIDSSLSTFIQCKECVLKFSDWSASWKSFS